MLGGFAFAVVPRLFGLFVGAVAPSHSFTYLQSRWCRVGKKPIINRCCTLLKRTVVWLRLPLCLKLIPFFVFENDPPPGQKLPRPNVFELSTTV